MSKPRVYSYIRFSNPEQAEGDSQRRQISAARRYAAEQGLDLDESLRTSDLGKSAYCGHHVKHGGLGTFLDACEKGIVPAKSVLVVEAVDRLTRLDHLDAVALLGQLLKHVDLHVVQLGRTFTEEDVRHDMGAIFTLVGAITVGHMESRQKAQRVGKAWSEKRVQVKESGVRLTKICPQWLEPKGEGFAPIPKRVKLVREIFERFAEGDSMGGIASDFNQRGVETFGRGVRWHRSYVNKILHNEGVRGVLHMGRKPRADRQRTIVETVEGYYPEVIPESLFVEVQRRLSASNNRNGGPSVLKNPLQGFLRCPHCGSPVSRENKGARARVKLVCSTAREGANTDQCRSLRVDYDRFWQGFREKMIVIADKGATGSDPRRVALLSAELEGATADLLAVREDVGSVQNPSRILIGALAKLENDVAGLEIDLREARRDTSLIWENLAVALRDPETPPSEISARLKSAFPEGWVLTEDNNELETVAA